MNRKKSMMSMQPSLRMSKLALQIGPIKQGVDERSDEHLLVSTDRSANFKRDRFSKSRQNTQMLPVIKDSEYTVGIHVEE